MNKRFWRLVLTRARANVVLSFVFGAGLGALGNIHPYTVLTVAAIIFSFVSILVVLDAGRSQRPNQLNEWEHALRRPSAHAAEHVTRANRSDLVVGQVIETLPHPNLSTRTTIEELGWLPNEIRITDLQEAFPADDILAEVGGLKEFDPPNGTKFAIADTSFVTLDSPILSLQLKRTNYFTLMSIKPRLEQQPALRSAFGSLDLPLNRIPHSISLQYAVRFSDGDLLALRRDPKAAYHPGLWSFSGEEQIAEPDMQFPHPIDALFRRAICEEVLALRDKNPATLDERWHIAEPIVTYMKLWSVFLEEAIFNYELAGIFQLNVDMREFVKIHRELVARGVGTTDSEGKFFCIKQASILSLLTDDKCEAFALFSNNSKSHEIVTADMLHPTSRYRLFRLARAINRKPLEPGTIL